MGGGQVRVRLRVRRCDGGFGFRCYLYGQGGRRSVLYISAVLFTPLLPAKSYVNKNVKSQDALAISSNLAQSSALVETKRFQTATECFIKKDKNNMLYSVARTDNKISIHLLSSIPLIILLQILKVL